MQARSERRHYLELKSAAVVLQSTWRGRQQRLQFARDREAVVTCQASVRRYLAVRTLNNLRRERRDFEVFCQHVTNIQQLWKARMTGRATRREFVEKKTAAITVQAWWRGVLAAREYQVQRSSVLLIQRTVRGWLARKFVERKRRALVALQRAAVMMKQRKQFLRTRQVMIRLQSRCRGSLARIQHRRLVEDEEYRQQLRLEAERLQQERRQEAALEVTRFLKTVRVRKTFLKQKKSAITIQKFWRGYWHRKVIMEQLSEMAATYKLVKDVKVRLEEATAAAKPEDSLGARTASAIDYIFSIRDVAQLIRAVKTLDFSTRISLDCCLKMTGKERKMTPVGQLVSLMSRCNRSEPHKEVIITMLSEHLIFRLCRLSPPRWTFSSTFPVLPPPARPWSRSPPSSPTYSRPCRDSTEIPARRFSPSAAPSSSSSPPRRM